MIQGVPCIFRRKCRPRILDGSIEVLVAIFNGLLEPHVDRRYPTDSLR